MQNAGDIYQRSKNFSVRIIRMFTSLPHTRVADVIGNQLLRSATSVGAHIREGKRSRSDAELISKAEGALMELEESVYWMELLIDSEIFTKER